MRCNVHIYQGHLIAMEISPVQLWRAIVTGMDSFLHFLCLLFAISNPFILFLMGQTLLLLLRKDALTCSLTCKETVCILWLPLVPDLADRNKTHCTRNIAEVKAPLSKRFTEKAVFGGVVSLCPKHQHLQPGFPGTSFLHLITFILLQELRVEQQVALTPEPNEFVAQL